MATEMLYSPSTGGFYLAAVHGEAIPPDAVALSAGAHAALMAEQAQGAQIVAGADGAPFAQRPAPPGEDAQRAALVAHARGEARRRIEAFAPLWAQSNDNAVFSLHAAGEAADAVELDAARARRGRIDAVRRACTALCARIAETPTAEFAALDPSADLHWAADSPVPVQTPGAPSL